MKKDLKYRIHKTHAQYVKVKEPVNWWRDKHRKVKVRWYDAIEVEFKYLANRVEFRAFEKMVTELNHAYYRTPLSLRTIDFIA